MQLEKRNSNLPEKIEELAEFVIYNSARLKGIMAGLAAVQRKKMPKDQWDGLQAQARDMQEEQLDAEVRLGEYFAGIKEDGRGRPKKGSTGEPILSKQTVIERLGFSESQGKRMETLAANKAIVEQVKAEAREEQDIPTRTAILKAVKEKERADFIAEVKSETKKKINGDRFIDILTTDKKFRIIHADPPWEYPGEQHSKEKQFTVADCHYPSMKLDEICALPVRNIAEKNAVLFIWTTWPMLFITEKVIEAWGFKYKSGCVWDKVKHNVGYYFSMRSELFLLATRGSCLPDIPELHDNVIEIPRTEHSVKPKEFQAMIDSMYPRGERIELFARGNEATNWHWWGNQEKAK